MNDMTDVKVDWPKVARLLLLSRELDRLETEQLTPQGKVKYQFSAGGHELAQILLALNLTHPHDAATVYYRSRPFMLASGLTAREALAAGMARTGSPSEGRDVGVVFSLPRRSGALVLPSSGDVGAQYTPAIGWAQAINYHANVLGEKDWPGAIAVALGGDGSVAANGFWAALNIATTLRLPMLFFIEDNGYGISVPSRYQTPGGDIAANLASYGGLRVLEGDGADPDDAAEKISQAVAHTRANGPCLLRMRVPRLAGHTFIDDQAYKSPEERADDQARDPLLRLRDHYLTPDLARTIKDELASAVSAVEASPDPDPAQATHHLFYQGPPPLVGGLRPANALPPFTAAGPESSGPRLNLLDAVRRALESEMRLNPRLLVFGEDVGVKGGVHGATLDMQIKFGADRVFDTSLSEEGIMGRAVGMALAGLLPVPEIQFRKYADPAHEQISDIGTVRWRTAGKFAAPMVVRIPVGYGKKTGDPWHSVTGEAVFAHTLGWRIAFPSNAADAVGLLRAALRGDDPTFFFEHRALLDTAPARRPYPGDDYCLPFGKAATLTEGDELTLVAWGEMVHRCFKAAASFAGRVTVIDLRTIIPWDKECVLNSVRRTGKALIVHEDTITGGFAGEIIATIVGECFADLDAPVERLATPDCPIPYNARMMEYVLPNLETIRARIQKLLDF
ncbi:MAG: pyruvate dehydrogenase [Chloroflexi bacterium]|nr:pyruvate dehydrogenase [Chloroflexota bacterium]